MNTERGLKTAEVEAVRRWAWQCIGDAAFWKLEGQRRAAERVSDEAARLLSRPMPRKRFRRRVRALNQRLNRIQREVIGF